MNAKLCNSSAYFNLLKFKRIRGKKPTNIGIKIRFKRVVLNLKTITNQTTEIIYIMKGDFNTESELRKQRDYLIDTFLLAVPLQPDNRFLLWDL